MSEEATTTTRRRGWFRRLLRGFVILAVLYFVLVLSGCMNPSTPVDYLLNLGSFDHDPDLAAPADGKRRMVVLEHGLRRSAGSLWKLERALEDHGYDVYNESYPTTSALIEELAAELGEDLKAHVAETYGESGPDEIYFVGHSMGGLLIRSYLSRPDALTATACVFIATPHRGAVLADKRRDWILFKVFMGDKAALQLCPSSPFYDQLKPMSCDCGVIFGGPTDGDGFSDDIPGRDDGKVSVAEAQLPEARDRVGLNYGHTRLTTEDETVRQALHFLLHREFEHAPE